MASASNSAELMKLFQNTHEEALRKNAENISYWTARKEEYMSVKSQLETLPNKLSHDVMVPVGTKALMRGKIVHTNEILVCLGDGWFVKQSAKLAGEICNRRIKFCIEMLVNLEKEHNLFASRKQLPLDEDAFGNEIMEPYDESIESEWRVRHRQKERDYRQQLAQQRKDNRVEEAGSTDEEFWRRLEVLELQEELEKEHLKRGHAVENVAPHYSSSEHSATHTLPSLPLEEIKPKRRVSFVDIEHSLSNEEHDYDSDSSDEPLSIEFSHTPTTDMPQQKTAVPQDPVTSPADIYNMFPKAPIKSILKSKLSTPVSNTDFVVESTESCIDSRSTDSAVSLPLAFGDVVEHSFEHQVPVEAMQAPPSRPVSRFRAARQTASTK